MRAFSQLFGPDPASRTRLSVPPTAYAKSPKSRFFRDAGREGADAFERFLAGEGQSEP